MLKLTILVNMQENVLNKIYFLRNTSGFSRITQKNAQTRVKLKLCFMYKRQKLANKYLREIYANFAQKYGHFVETLHTRNWLILSYLGWQCSWSRTSCNCSYFYDCWRGNNSSNQVFKLLGWQVVFKPVHPQLGCFVLLI